MVMLVWVDGWQFLTGGGEFLRANGMRLGGGAFRSEFERDGSMEYIICFWFWLLRM